MLLMGKLSYGLLVLGLLSKGYCMDLQDNGMDVEAQNNKREAEDALDHPGAKKTRTEDQDHERMQEISIAPQQQAQEQQLQQKIENALKLGNDFYTGQGVPQNYINAAFYYQQAAEAGSPIAQHILGRMLFNGNGLRIDKKKAAEWFLKSAQQGHPDAQYQIAGAYFEGIGVPRNFSDAVAFFELAEKNEVSPQNSNLVNAYYHLAMEFQEKFRLISGVIAPDKDVSYDKVLNKYVYRDASIHYYRKAKIKGHADAGDRIKTVGEKNYFIDFAPDDVCGLIFNCFLSIKDSLQIRSVCKGFKACVKRAEDTLPSTFKGPLSIFPNLTELNLSHNRISIKEGITILTKLTKLNLSSNNIITNEELKKLTNLTQLNLERNEIISNPGIKMLTKLVDLNLSRAKKFNDNGIKKLTNLAILNLEWCCGKFTDEGIKNLTNLTHLTLPYYNTKITNEGIRKLPKLLKVPHVNTF